MWCWQIANIKIFKRYVDDYFVIIDKQTDSKKLLNAFNAAHPSIKFEMETLLDDNSLSLLYVNIRVAENGELSTKFYEKSTKQGDFLRAQSPTPSQMKTSAVRAEYNRMQKLLSTHTAQEVG